MRKFVAMAAVLGLMAVPAFADLTPSSFSPVLANLSGSGAHTVGPITAGGNNIYTNITFSSSGTAGTQFVTFAFHWPFTSTVGLTGLQFWSSVVWDNTELQIMSVKTAGAIWGGGANNYNSIANSFWSGVTLPGLVQVGDVLGTGVPLWQNPTFVSTAITSSSVNAFMKIGFKVRAGAPDDSGLDLVIGSAAMLFRFSTTPGTYWTAGAVGSPSFGLNRTPEPASLSLLALGAVATGAGVWRRRR